MTAPHRNGLRGMAATLRSVLNFRPIELDPVARRLRGAANVDDLRRLAKRRLPRGVFDYIDGAAEDERTMAANRAGFADLTFSPRVLTGVGEPDPSTTLLGETIPLPIVLAPTGFTRLAHSEGELAVARAAARAGLPYTLSTLGTYSIEDVAAVNDATKWFQVYVFRDRGLVRDMVQRAAAAGYRAIPIDSLPFPQPASSPLSTARQEALQATVDRSVADATAAGVQGVTVAVVSPDGSWAGVAGVDGTSVPLVPTSMSDIASITKTVTAADTLTIDPGTTLTVDIDGTQHTVQTTGNGPVDATFNAIKLLVPHEAKLALYQVHAVTEGTDAQAEVSVRLEEDGRTVTGRGADTDTMVASARAYLAALNKLMVKRQKTAQVQQAI